MVVGEVWREVGKEDEGKVIIGIFDRVFNNS